MVGDGASEDKYILYKEIFSVPLCVESFVRVTDDQNRGNRFLRID